MYYFDFHVTSKTHDFLYLCLVLYIANYYYLVWCIKTPYTCNLFKKIKSKADKVTCPLLAGKRLRPDEQTKSRDEVMRRSDATKRPRTCTPRRRNRKYTPRRSETYNSTNYQTPRRTRETTS